jgi:hypothetical protein
MKQRKYTVDEIDAMRDLVWTLIWERNRRDHWASPTDDEVELQLRTHLQVGTGVSDLTAAVDALKAKNDEIEKEQQRWLREEMEKAGAYRGDQLAAEQPKAKAAEIKRPWWLRMFPISWKGQT